MKPNLLRKVKAGLCVILIIVSLLCVLNVYAISYNHLFTQFLGTGSVANAKSPCRGANPFVYDNVGIISKMNQARKANGTNPHQGVDFYMSAGTDVYPIMGGVVYYIDRVNTQQQRNVIIKSTINGVDYLVTYLHIEPLANLDVNDIVDVFDKIGEVAEQLLPAPDGTIRGYTPHLHITCQTNEDQNLYKTGLYQFFRTNASYNYGKDMDVITGGYFSGNTFYITAYFRSNGGTHPEGMPFHCKSLTVYYKIFHVRTQTEETNSITYETSIYHDPLIPHNPLLNYEHELIFPSNYDPLTYTYSIDFSQFIGSDYDMECGDTLQFYVAVVREGHSNDYDCDFNTMLNDHTTEPIHDGTMDYSIWPMYYDQPAKDMTGASVVIYGESYTNSNTHQWSVWSVKTQPTCTTKGTEYRTCNNCDAEETRDYGSPLGHNYGAATCELPATCTRCGATTGSALGHDYNAATCELPATCTRCGATTGSALGHDYSDATCESPATCTRCGATTGSALGHNMSAWSVTTPATCFSPGDKVRYCMRTGCSYSEEDTIPENPSNHAGGSYWTITTAATCTNSGIRSQICYGCYGVLSTQPIAALGHNWGSWIYQYGYYDEDLQYYVRVYKRTCSRCGIYEYDYLD